MKALYLKSLVAAALAVTLSSCEKKAENIENLSQLKTQVSGIVYPIEGVDQSTNILPKRKLPRAVLTKGYGEYQKIKVKVIDTVCDEYILATKKVDFSGLKEGKYVTSFGTNEFKILTDPDFIRRGVVKLSNGPKGWWTHWNYSPYTESEYPVVLFAKDRNGNTVDAIDLSFLQSLKMFGFEIAPNTTGRDVKIIVEFKESSTYRSPTMFEVEQTISSPSGARLIAVKSDRSFEMASVKIVYDREVKSTGLAITNIRYGIAN